MEKKLKLSYLSGLASFIFLTSLCLGAHALERSPFIPFIINYSIAFAAFWWLMAKGKLSFNQMFVLAVFIRVLILFSMPLLSQDYVRFIWDGVIQNLGQNPYAFTPNEILENQLLLIPNQETLINGMGTLSAQHYSNYPPLNQIFFFIATFLGGKSIFWSVVWLRVIILAAEVGIILTAKKLLYQMQLPLTSIFWYVLNPLVVLELNSNLHMESIMLFFFFFCIYCLTKKSIMWASVLFAASVLSKLFTLFLLPFLFFFITPKGTKISLDSILQPRFIVFTFCSVFLVIAGFFAFGWLEHASNYIASVGLWFGTFEFNASIYYVFRWVGYQLVGWNAITVITKLLLGLLAVGYFGLLLKINSANKEFIFTQMMWATCLYFVLSTTVHPWYLATPLLLSVFTKFRFMQVWSYTVMFSYAAYASVKVDEPTLLLYLQYVLPVLFLMKEMRFFNSPTYSEENN